MSRSTFISRYGLVKYPVPGYAIPSECEIRGCEEYRVKAYLLPEFKRVLREYESSVNSGELTIDRGHEIVYREPTFVLDHCHKHGWVRGVICGTCNNLMSIVDRDGYIPPVYVDADQLLIYPPNGWHIEPINRSIEARTILAPGLIDHRNKCPECAGIATPNSLSE